MDLGATLCVRGKPRCEACPVSKTCVALRKGLIERLPSPRPRREVPLKSTTWLVLRHAGQVLLERRPSAGIWGGLWSFPEADGIDVADRCSNLGYALSCSVNLDPIEHGFTHFRLTIQPVLCEVDRTPRAEAPGRIWLDVCEAQAAATPAPVKRLLQSLSASGPAGR